MRVGTDGAAQDAELDQVPDADDEQRHAEDPVDGGRCDGIAEAVQPGEGLDLALADRNCEASRSESRPL